MRQWNFLKSSVKCGSKVTMRKSQGNLIINLAGNLQISFFAYGVTVTLLGGTSPLQSRKVGLVAVVMVGAANVGKMSLTYDDTITNQIPRTFESELVRSVSGVSISVGDRLGTFHLGSTVVLLFEPGMITASPELLAQNSGPIKFGQLIATPKISRAVLKINVR